MLLKRCFDFITALIGLVILFPIFVLITFVSAIINGPPVFFKQERAGRHGKPFTIIKFRTMIVNHGGNTVSVKGQNRITPFGGFLRKYKLDELPELWNVLIGDMSFVGPRPDVSELVESLSKEEKQILERMKRAEEQIMGKKSVPGLENEQEPKSCPECGHRIGDGWNYCASCGFLLSKETW